MTTPLDLLSSHACFGGEQRFYQHASTTIGLPMKFSVYLPPQAQQGRDGAVACLGRQVHRKFHRQADGARIMAVEALLAAKAGMAAQQFQMGGHGLLTKE